MRPHGRKARVNPGNPEAFAQCDRCGDWRNRTDLVWQYEWSGTHLYSLGFLVCLDRCYDTPQEQFRTIILPPDPPPVLNARPPNFAYEENGPPQTILTANASFGSQFLSVQQANVFNIGDWVWIQLNTGSFAQIQIGIVNATSNILGLNAPLPALAPVNGSVTFSYAQPPTSQVDVARLTDGASLAVLVSQIFVTNPAAYGGSGSLSALAILAWTASATFGASGSLSSDSIYAPQWLQAYLVGGALPTLFADFTTEGGMNHYFADAATDGSFSAWLTALGGTFTRASSATYVNSSGVLSTASSNVPRFDYAGGLAQGLLLEGTTANLAYPSMPTAAQADGSSTITTNSQPFADGTTTASLVTEPNGAVVECGLYWQILSTTAQYYTFSCWIDPSPSGSKRWAYIIGYPNGGGNGSAGVTFDPVTGAFTFPSGTPAGGITSFTYSAQLINGLWRVSVTYNVNAGGTFTQYIWLSDTNNGSTGYVYTGDGVSGLSIGGGQFEANFAVSSYIPTTSGTATRAADFLTIPQTLSTIAVTVLSNAEVTANGYGVFTLNDSLGSSNRIDMRSIGATYGGVMTSNGTNEPTASIAAGNASAGNSVAISVQAGAYNAAINETASTPTAPAAMPTVLNQIRIGNIDNGGYPMNGWYAQFGVWSGVAATAAKLQVLTSYYSPQWLQAYSIGGVKPTLFADFTTASDYYFNNSAYGSFTDWMAACGGTFTRSGSNASYINASGVLVTAAANTPRFDYTGGTAQGLLLEGASTNGLPYSNNFAAGDWSADGTGVTESTSGTLGPDGSTYFTAINEGTATGSHVWGGPSTGSFGTTTQTLSIYLAAGTRRYVSLVAYGANNGGGFYAVVDTQAWTISDAGVSSYGSFCGTYTGSTLTEIVPGIYRLSVTGNVGAPNSIGTVVVISPQNVATCAGGNIFPSYTGTSQTVLVWGVQAEAANAASSYIATSGAAASRAADTLGIPWTATAGTFLGNTVRVNPTKVNNYAVSNQIMSYGVDGRNTVLGVYADTFNSVFTGGGGAPLPNGSGTVWSNANSSAVTGNSSKRLLTINGAAVVSDTNPLFGGDTPTMLYIGNDLDGDALFGCVSQIGVWSVVATADQLQALT